MRVPYRPADQVRIDGQVWRGVYHIWTEVEQFPSTPSPTFLVFLLVSRTTFQLHEVLEVSVSTHQSTRLAEPSDGFQK